MKKTQFRINNRLTRVRIGLLVAVLGFLLFLLGAAPGLFGLDRSQTTGFIQIAVFLVGLGLICLGGGITLNALWNGRQKSIAADIGYRLVATGYLVSVVAGIADIIGFGSHPLLSIPSFGPWQAIGVSIGGVLIGIGFLLMIPPRKASPL